MMDEAKERDLMDAWRRSMYPRTVMSTEEHWLARARIAEEWLPMNHPDIEQVKHDGEEILVTYPLQQNVMQLVRFNRVYERWENKGAPQLGIEHQQCLWCRVAPPAASGDGATAAQAAEGESK